MTAARPAPLPFPSFRPSVFPSPERPREPDPRPHPHLLGRLPLEATPISPSRTSPSASSARGMTRTSRPASAWPSAIRSSTSPPAMTRAGSRASPSARREACAAAALNPLLALGRESWRALRQQASALLASDSPARRANRRLGDRVLVPMREAELLLPAAIGDYTDFYASIHHATNVGAMFRPDNPLLPNYKWVPIGYHGRASSDRGQRDVGAPAAEGSSRIRKRRCPGRTARRARWTTRWRWDFSWGPATRPANRCRWIRRRRTSSDSRWSTTGPRATYRAGSTSRSALSSPRAS